MSSTISPLADRVPTGRDALRNVARLAAVLRPYWRRLAKAVALSIVISVFSLVTPLLTKLFFDVIYPAHDVGLMRALVLGIAVTGIVAGLMSAVRNYYVYVLGTRMHTELGLLFFNHVQHVETGFFDGRPVGEILSRSEDLQRSLGFVTGSFHTALANGIYLFFIPPVLLLLNWRLAVLALCTIPVTTGLTLLLGRATRGLSKRSMELGAEVGAYQYEVLSNVRVVKASAAESDVFARMRARVLSSQAAQVREGGLSAALTAVNATATSLSNGLYLWLAWSLVLDQRLTIGTFLVFSAYLGYLSGPVGQFASLFDGFQQAAVALGRFFEYYDAPLEQDPVRSVAPRPAPACVLSGSVSFRDVRFGYDPERPVLNQVTLDVPAGSVAAFVGRSGSGKSSLVKLLLGMYAPQAGRVLVGGRPLSAIDVGDLRRQVAAVWQEHGVFRGTLRDNIVFGSGPVSDEAIEAAVHVAQLDDLVASLSRGIDTAITEWGGSLSGGQRQRLAIARALVRRSPILVLDEATSALDARTENDLLRAILGHARGTTVLFVTHRLVSARLADRIFLVEAGHVSGGHSHAAMLKSSEAYGVLWSAATGADHVGAVRESQVGSERLGPDRLVAVSAAGS